MELDRDEMLQTTPKRRTVPCARTGRGPLHRCLAGGQVGRIRVPGVQKLMQPVTKARPFFFSRSKDARFKQGRRFFRRHEQKKHTQNQTKKLMVRGQ